MNAGYYDEARAWRDWLLRAVAGSPAQMQIMYGIAGERRLTEWELPWLPGYEGSRPVRIGNAAHGAAPARRLWRGDGRAAPGPARRASPADDAGWALQRALLEHLETVWREPDEGIWEVRGPRRHFTHSKVMAWVAFDRAVQSVESSASTAPVDRWRAAARARSTREVCRHGFDAERNSFVQSYGVAAARREPAADCRSSASCRRRSAHRRHGGGDRARLAGRRPGAALRHRAQSTTACRPARARSSPAASGSATPNHARPLRRGAALFERLLALRNDVGLLAEEYDPRRAGSSATSRRRSRIWRWSTRPSI